MTLYDGVVGIDEAALNQFVQSAYQALHDVALKGTVTLQEPEFGVSAIGYDVASVPQVSLSPSALVQQYRRALLAAMNVPADSLDSAAAAQSQASFGLTVQTLQVAVDYADGSTPTQFQASAQATVSISGNELMVKLDALDNITITLDVHGLPGFLDGVISDIVNTLGTQISAALTPLIAALPPQPITKIPSIPITVKGETVVITLQNAGVTTIQTLDGKTLLAMTGGADVVVNPPMPQHIANIARPQLVAAGT
jgi:hypothetical protein